jgi:CRISPR-associated endonuclease Csn1
VKRKSTKHYRLGLDVGTNSIGWFVVWIEWDKELDRWRTRSLGPGGVRVFPDGRDPQSGTSNAVDRRTARGARKRRDRFANRRKSLMEALVRHGLMPADANERKALEELDPYELRSKALNDPLPAPHVGRALFHLNQRRGFLSNRKAEKADDDKGAIKQGATRLTEAMKRDGAGSLGQFLWQKHAFADASEVRRNAIRAELKRLGKDCLVGNKRKKAWANVRKRLFPNDTIDKRPHGVRARGTLSGTKMTYDFYPTRAHLSDEFNKIWKAQSPHHPSMTKAHKEIHNIIFYQRPLKPPVVGKCSLDPATRPFYEDPEGYRAPWAHPLAQRFRILQEARNLAVGETGRSERKLKKEESDKVILALLQPANAKAELTFDKIRSLLDLPSEARFNLESERRPFLVGDQTAARLSDKKRFGKAWRSLSPEQQIAVIEKLLDEPDEDELVEWLVSTCGLVPETAQRVADMALPEGHCRLGLRAIKKILPHMEAGLGYHEAAAKAGYDHAKLPTGEILDRLPYYGEWLPDAVVGSGDPRDIKERKFGFFPNPTVHIGLGQLRRLVNGLIKEHGAPTEIVVEFTRALKLSPTQRTEVRREQRRNQDKNTARAAELAKLGVEANARNLMKMRLWEELNPRDPVDRKCPFTGENISLTRLMSEEVEIEHLIPFKDSLDESAANKIVCLRHANRAKRKLTPYEAFGSSPTIDGFKYQWDEITARAAGLQRNKRWRFDPDAREKFEKMGGFIGRQLNETGWLARVAKQYLGAVTDPYQIWVVPGRLTSMIRAKWGLNSLLPDHNYPGVERKTPEFLASTDDMEFAGVKNRADHRHHAIDALVAALTDRSLLWKIASAYDEQRDRIITEPPWGTMRDELKAALDRMTVSHKPDHGVQGKLHEDTAYGFVKEPEKEGANLVYRKPIESLNANEIERIRDRRLREIVQRHVAEEAAKGVSLADALRKLHTLKGERHITNGLRHVRLLKPEKPEYLVPVKDRQTGVPYKAYSAGENFCVEIYELPDGNWDGEAITRFAANQEAYHPRWRTAHPDARSVMRIHKGDLLRLEHKGKPEIMVVHRLDAAAGRFKLAPHNETGNLDRRHATDNEVDPFRWLMASYGTLKKIGAVPVRVDELGRVWRIHLNS